MLTLPSSSRICPAHNKAALNSGLRLRECALTVDFQESMQDVARGSRPGRWLRKALMIFLCSTVIPNAVHSNVGDGCFELSMVSAEPPALKNEIPRNITEAVRQLRRSLPRSLLKDLRYWKTNSRFFSRRNAIFRTRILSICSIRNGVSLYLRLGRSKLAIRI